MAGLERDASGRQALAVGFIEFGGSGDPQAGPERGRHGAPGGEMGVTPQSTRWAEGAQRRDCHEGNRRAPSGPGTMEAGHRTGPPLPVRP